MMADRSERLAQLKAMAAESPDDALTFFLLGSEQLHVGQAAEAAAALRRCQELNPLHTAAVRLLGDAYRHLGQAELARATYERAIALAEQTGDLQVAKEARALLKRLDS